MAAADEQCDGNGADGGAGGATSLAEDEAFEMLTRVSLDDLAACRDVCAHWRRLTYEAAFAPLHLRRAAGGGFVSGYLVQGLARNRYSATFVSSTSGAEVSLDFLPCSPSVRIEAVSAHRGLACCVDPTAFSLSSGAKPSSRCYYMCKPATKQWRALPSPRLRFPTAATAMIARPAPAGADLKILRLSIPTLRDRLRCEIFDSRRRKRGGGWRRSQDVPLWPESLAGAGPAVRAHGAMHWLRWPDSLTAAEDIFAFDMRSETWRLVRIPPELEEKAGAQKKLAAVEGRLCLVAVTDDGEAEVWAVAGYGGRAERWEKKMTVRLENLAAMDGRALVFRDLCSSDVAFLNTVYTVIW